ncbi:MAG TPA: biopolymer transporter ExbD [Blastocatellia bacterium]|jgi:biopolymer transport protein TolR|nr:biopolymer transporter ExbD [Blastocatellia bacterium]
MAFTNQQGRTQTSLAEINVTPLVDVMLVLLVIFMVTAPILQTGIDVNLPKTRESRAEQPKPRSVVVSIDKDGNIYLSTQTEAKQVNVNDLPNILSEKLGQSGERQVYVRGDGETPYRIIAYVLDVAKQAGAEVSLVTEPTLKKR